MNKRPLTNKARAACALELVLAKTLTTAPRPDVVMFSGGYDSVFLYEQARRNFSGVLAVTVAFGGYNPRTVAEAVRAAGQLRAKHLVIPVSLKEYLISAMRVDALLTVGERDYDLMAVHAALLKLPRSRQCLWTGMGCDAWLGEHDDGSLLSVAARRRKARDLMRSHDLVARDAGRRFFFPFFQPAVIDVAARVPVSFKKGKVLFRSLAPRLSALCPPGGRLEVQVPSRVKDLTARVLQ